MPEGARHVKKLRDVAKFGTKESEIAIYDRKRFWCITGQRLEGTPRSCEPRQEALDALLLKLFPAKAASPDRSKPVNGAARMHLSASAVLDRLVNDCAVAPEGQRSELDFALCLPPFGTDGIVTKFGTACKASASLPSAARAISIGRGSGPSRTLRVRR